MSQAQGTASDWMQDPLMQAAAFEGLAGNRAYSIEERLAFALTACKHLRVALGAPVLDNAMDEPGGMPTAAANGDPQWYIEQRAEDRAWHRMDKS